MLKKILTAKHRGFCAGVERAVEIVEKSLIKYGSPVYVRHEIVHNKFVVENLKEKGVIFVESLDEVPQGTNQPVIFSAHGVAQRVIEKAKNYNFLFAGFFVGYSIVRMIIRPQFLPLNHENEADFQKFWPHKNCSLF